MRAKIDKCILLSIFITGITQVVFANVESTTNIETKYKIYIPADIQWQSGLNSLPKGVMYAILEGNPANPGPFTLRLKLPANYRIPPHIHPGIEHITVISGKLLLGMGDKIDARKAKTLPAGSFAYLRQNIVHFALAPEETILQIHGIGPWAIHYVNPND